MSLWSILVTLPASFFRMLHYVLPTSIWTILMKNRITQTVPNPNEEICYLDTVGRFCGSDSCVTSIITDRPHLEISNLSSLTSEKNEKSNEDEVYSESSIDEQNVSVFVDKSKELNMDDHVCDSAQQTLTNSLAEKRFTIIYEMRVNGHSSSILAKDKNLIYSLTSDESSGDEITKESGDDVTNVKFNKESSDKFIGEGFGDEISDEFADKITRFLEKSRDKISDDSSGAEITGEESGGEITGEESGGEISGEASADQITGESSGDQITGESSGDQITGESSGDQITWEASGDQITGDASGGEISGEASDDQIMGELSGDQITGEASCDGITGEASGGEISFEEFGDKITGEASGDEITGESSGDQITGEASGDEITGEASGGEISEKASGGEITRDASGGGIAEIKFVDQATDTMDKNDNCESNIKISDHECYDAKNLIHEECSSASKHTILPEISGKIDDCQPTFKRYFDQHNIMFLSDINIPEDPFAEMYEDFLSPTNEMTPCEFLQEINDKISAITRKSSDDFTPKELKPDVCDLNDSYKCSLDIIPMEFIYPCLPHSMNF